MSLADWRETILCPQVKWMFGQRQTVFDLQLNRIVSEEELPVYEVDASCLAPTWGVFLQGGWVFDPSDMKWRMGSHEEHYGRTAGGLIVATRGGGMEWRARVTEAEIRGLIAAGTYGDVHRMTKHIVDRWARIPWEF